MQTATSCLAETSKTETVSPAVSASAPSHESLVQGLREIIDCAQISVLELDYATAEMRPFLPAGSRAEIQSRLDYGDLTAVRLAVLGGLSAATLLRMMSSSLAFKGLAWEDWLKAVLEAVDLSSIEDDALRQLAFDVLVCNLSDLESLEDEPQQEDNADLLPTLSLPHFRILQQQGRYFLGIQ